MTAHEALSEGRLTEAIDRQRETVAASPTDPAAQLFLAELLLLAGEFVLARQVLAAIETPAEDWPQARRRFRQLIRAEVRRSLQSRRPKVLAPPPSHLRRRWRALKHLLAGDGDSARKTFDGADSASPWMVGHIDGREFEGLRDTDDRYASVFEVFLGPDYYWIPFDMIRVIRFAPMVGAIDQAYRGVMIRLHDGTEMAGMTPLIYPGSFDGDGAFAAGLDTDWPEVPGGVVCGIGRKIWMIGDDELPVGEFTQLELRQGT